MNLSRVLKVRYLVVVLLVLIVAASAYAFAAANAVPETGAGDGTGVISGYTISGVTYTLNSSNPANIDAVKFDVAPTGTSAAAPATSVKIQLITGGTWFGCTAGTPVPPKVPWTCSGITGVTALAATNLHVVAAQ
jgi:hypothetical protein